MLLSKNQPVRVSLPTETHNSKEEFELGVPSSADISKTEAATRAPLARIDEHWLDLPDGRMRYLKAGSGPPLILVHGLLGYSFSWRFTIPALAPHATVYAIDNLGAGLSTANKSVDCTLRATAERVLQFADAVGIRDFDLLGTSHGGGVAIMVAVICSERAEKEKAEKNNAEHDVRLKRLVLVAPINPWSPHGKRLAPFAGSPLGSLLVCNTVGRWRSLDYLWLSRMFGDTAKIPADSLDGYRIPVIKNNAFRHGIRIVKNWTYDLAELRESLPKIRNYPTLLLWGTKDGAVHFKSAEPLRQNFCNANLIAFEGVGHLPYEEAPGEFNRALIGFLTSDTGSQSAISCQTPSAEN
jgi:pimeloyl-ACP methyl ester carboxylesterase